LCRIQSFFVIREFDKLRVYWCAYWLRIFHSDFLQLIFGICCLTCQDFFSFWFLDVSQMLKVLPPRTSEVALNLLTLISRQCFVHSFSYSILLRSLRYCELMSNSSFLQEVLKLRQGIFSSIICA